MTLRKKDAMLNLIIRLTEVELTTGSIRMRIADRLGRMTRNVGFFAL